MHAAGDGSLLASTVRAMKKPARKTKATKRKSSPATAPRARAGARKRKTSSEGDDEGKGSGQRSLWTGAIAFGLVQIPVRLIVAESSDQLSFHQVDRRDMARIRYQRINEDTGEVVEWADITKSYELEDGSIVPIDDEDFEKANVEASHTIDIQDFVKRSEIPLAYFERPYFIVPQRSAKPYAVLRDALIKKDYVAIALVVIRTRQHLCAIVPEGKGLTLELLRFPEELRPASTVASELPAAHSATAKELALAEQLVESLAGEWDPSKYQDTFKADMLAAIERKAKTGKLPKPRKKAAPGGKVTDLVALLKKSMAAGGKAKPTARGKKKETAA